MQLFVWARVVAALDRTAAGTAVIDYAQYAVFDLQTVVYVDIGMRSVGCWSWELDIEVDNVDAETKAALLRGCACPCQPYSTDQ
jgi:hypothetical protein